MEPEPDYAEMMRALVEDYLPKISEHATDEDIFFRVNLLRRAARDAVDELLELEQTGRW